MDFLGLNLFMDEYEEIVELLNYGVLQVICTVISGTSRLSDNPGDA